MKPLMGTLVLALMLVAPVSSHPAKALKPSSAPTPVVDVYYFHGNSRCMSCMKIEAYTKEAVATRFAADVKNGRVVMHVVNLEAPGNQHYVEDFKIETKTVVVTRSVSGKRESFRKLDRVWMLLNYKDKFLAYVAKNVDAVKKGV